MSQDGFVLEACSLVPYQIARFYCTHSRFRQVVILTGDWRPNCRAELMALPDDADDLSFGNSIYRITFDERQQSYRCLATDTHFGCKMQLTKYLNILCNGRHLKGAYKFLKTVMNVPFLLSDGLAASRLSMASKSRTTRLFTRCFKRRVTIRTSRCSFNACML